MSKWEIVEARREHVPAIAENMREADIREVWASGRHTPQEALEFSLESAELSWTCLVDGVPAFMWGVSHRTLLSLEGIPWLLGTELLLKVQREFLKQSRNYISLMQERFSRLENYVHTENKISMRWLRWCRFNIEDFTVDINNEKFFRFWR